MNYPVVHRWQVWGRCWLAITRSRPGLKVAPGTTCACGEGATARERRYGC